MSSAGSKVAISRAAPLLAALCAALLLACADRASAPQAETPAAVEPEEPRSRARPASGDEAKAEAAAAPPVTEDLESGRFLYGSYASRSDGLLEASSEPGRKRQARNAPDADALQELAAKTSQSLNQRANEAFDYLGEARRHERGSEGDATGSEAAAAEREETELSAVQRFERERRSLDGLRFQPASGYWANTYVPGDPVMRWLESRLQTGDRDALEAFAAQPLLLDAAAHQTPQPFDPPRDAALSVFLAADRRGLEGEQRMLVQVGLQGAERHGRLRPAMNVGIVFDLRGEVPNELAPALRALLDAFLDAKDVGDRFSLTVAGQPGGRLIAADAFRHGPVSLAMSQLLAPRASRGPEEPARLGLEQAVRETAAELRQSDDPAAPLGSSLVLLVTGQPLGSLTGPLASLAHRSAVAGVPVSVIGVGDAVEIGDVEQVALAGQGSLRLLERPDDAEALVERELSALSQVIARALRLRIRLAPGVKLVEVVGSERLDAAGADRVRRAERSIDRRMARNLGIEADRGEDEAGIQIVMPTFYSGDAHAVLLDVVASGPGPIADVTVRYKDLVYLRNGVARANLTLGRSSDPPGPLQRNVVKNLLALQLSETLKQAGRDLLAGGDAEAIASVRRFQTLLEGLRREVPGFQNDADLSGDADLLGEYLAMLQTDALDRAEPRQYLADSLQLSGYFKTVPRR